MRDSIDVIEEAKIDVSLINKMKEYYKGLNKSRYANSALSKYEIGKIMRNC